MALVKCPECGKEVSSSTSQCIHCGCKYTVCPDCGIVMAGNADVCSNCGCVIQKNNAEVLNDYISGTVEGVKQANIIDVWGRKNSANKAAMKTIKVSRKVFGFLTAIPICIAIILVVVWNQYSIEQKILSMQSTFNAVIAMVVIDVLITFLDFNFEGISEMFLKIRLLNWINKEKVDYRSYLHSHLNDYLLADDSVEELELLKGAAYFKEFPKGKIYSFIDIILQSCTCLAFCICLGVQIVNVAKDFMYHSLMDSTYQFNFEALILPAIFLAIYIVTVVLTICLDPFYKWFKKFEKEIQE